MKAILKYLLVLESPKMRHLQRLLSNPLCLEKVKVLKKEKRRDWMRLILK